MHHWEKVSLAIFHIKRSRASREDSTRHIKLEVMMSAGAAEMERSSTVLAKVETPNIHAVYSYFCYS